MAEIQEFAVGTECVTASMTLPLDGEDHYGKPLTIGIYPGAVEVWIEGDCGRQNIPLRHLEAVIKQLRRAAKIARENSND